MLVVVAPLGGRHVLVEQGQGLAVLGDGLADRCAVVPAALLQHGDAHLAVLLGAERLLGERDDDARVLVLGGAHPWRHGVLRVGVQDVAQLSSILLTSPTIDDVVLPSSIPATRLLYHRTHKNAISVLRINAWGVENCLNQRSPDWACESLLA